MADKQAHDSGSEDQGNRQDGGPDTGSDAMPGQSSAL